jgi:hypothetical protein
VYTNPFGKHSGKKSKANKAPKSDAITASTK